MRPDCETKRFIRSRESQSEIACKEGDMVKVGRITHNISILELTNYRFLCLIKWNSCFRRLTYLTILHLGWGN